MTKAKVFLLAAALTVAASSTAYAHRLNVFAYAQGRQICVEASFAGGKPAMNSEVTFLNEKSEKFLTAQTSPQGKVCANLPENFVPQPVTVIVNAGEGHQNRWQMNKEDFSSEQPSVEEAPSSALAPSVSSEPSKEQTGEPKLYTQSQLNEAVRAAKEDAEKNIIAPLRRQLAEAKQPQITWRDIFGGIGWLVGLGGLFAWITTRRQKK